jgi:hypothetical protein
MRSPASLRKGRELLIPSIHRPGSKKGDFFGFLLAGIILTLSACAGGHDLDVTIHESERGAVYIERISDRSFHAAHPIALPTDTMARVLRGVVITNGRGLLANLLTRKSETARAFRDEDVAYLAPLLAEGLSRAASDQQVGFRVFHLDPAVSSPSSGMVFCSSSVRSPGVCSSEQPLLTEGSLYVYGQSLYLTLTEYRHRMERGETSDKTDRRLANPNGLLNYTVQFIPESAKRPDSYRTRQSTDSTLVIDYDRLATMPATPSLRPTDAQSPTPAQGEAIQRGTDLDGIRKELEDIKKKLAEQEAERIRSKP